MMRDIKILRKFSVSMYTLSSMIFYFVMFISKYFFSYPELYFALYLTAGVYKADPRLSFINNILDLTIFFEVLTLLGIIYLFLKRKSKIFFPPLKIFLPYMFFACLVTSGLLHTSAPNYGIDKALRFLLITTPSFFVPLMIFRNKDTYKRFMFFFVILSIAMTLDIITGGLSVGSMSFKEAFGSNYLAVGRISGLAILYSSIFLIMSKKFLYRILHFIFLIAFTFNIFISGGRGPLISLGFCISFLFFYLLSQFKFNFKTYSLIMDKRELKILNSIVIIFIISLALLIIFRDYFVFLFYRFSFLEKLSGESIEERLRLYRKAIEAVKSNVFNSIFGLGAGGFSTFYKGYDANRIYPHNIFLEVMSEFGILGLFSFLAILINSLFVAFGNLKISRTIEDLYLSYGIILGILFMVFNSSFSGDINDNRLLFVFLGLALSYRRLLRNEKN